MFEMGYMKAGSYNLNKAYPKWGKEVDQKLRGVKELIATPPSHIRSHHLHTQSCEGKKESRKQTTTYTYSLQTPELQLFPFFGRATEKLLGLCGNHRNCQNCRKQCHQKEKNLFLINSHL